MHIYICKNNKSFSRNEKSKTVFKEEMLSSRNLNSYGLSHNEDKCLKYYAESIACRVTEDFNYKISVYVRQRVCVCVCFFPQKAINVFSKN